jgi:hypothetical protein
MFRHMPGTLPDRRCEPTRGASGPLQAVPHERFIAQPGIDLSTERVYARPDTRVEGWHEMCEHVFA